MRSMVACSLVWGAFFISGLIGPSKPSGAANCALYARAQTGVALFGSAGAWWDEADGRYRRGHAPEVGAILVFKRTSRIPSGHVAVVTKVVSANEILVDHANWYRGRVNRGMSVIDTSPGHDWTSVAVVDFGSGKPGRDYPTYGFIYPGTGPREIVEAQYGNQLDTYVADSWRSLDASGRPAFLRVAFTSDDEQLGSSRPALTRAHRHRSGAAAHPVRHNRAQAHARPASPANLDKPVAD
jgi:surface antigen